MQTVCEIPVNMMKLHTKTNWVKIHNLCYFTNWVMGLNTCQVQENNSVWITK